MYAKPVAIVTVDPPEVPVASHSITFEQVCVQDGVADTVHRDVHDDAVVVEHSEDEDCEFGFPFPPGPVPPLIPPGGPMPGGQKGQSEMQKRKPIVL